MSSRCTPVSVLLPRLPFPPMTCRRSAGPSRLSCRTSWYSILRWLLALSLHSTHTTCFDNDITLNIENHIKYRKPLWTHIDFEKPNTKFFFNKSPVLLNFQVTFERRNTKCTYFWIFGFEIHGSGNMEHPGASADDVVEASFDGEICFPDGEVGVCSGQI